MADNWRDFPLPDGSYSDDCKPFTQQDVVNYLPTFAEANGTRGPIKYRTVPGLAHFSNVGDGPHRGGRDVEGKVFVVSGRHLYQVASDGLTTDKGIIPGTGRVSMTHNQIDGGNELVIATGDNSYVYNTVTEVLAATGVPLICVDFLNQRILGVDRARRFWRYSGVATAVAWDALDNESAESSPDRIVGGIVSQGDWYVFGERTIEVFSNSPTETTAFQRTQVIEKGCAAPDTICRLDNSIFFVGNDGVPYRLNGYTPVPIAPKAIIDTISQSQPRRLYAFTWEDKGYAVYYVTAQDGETFGYDVTTQKWHRRQSYGLTRWRINTLFKANGYWYAGDAFTRRLYRLQWGYVYEGCEIMPRIIKTGVLHNNTNRVRIPGFRLTVATGGVPSVPNCPERQNYLLTTGTRIVEDPFSTSLGIAAPMFSAIPNATGANIDAAIPGHYAGTWAAGAISGARYSTNNLASWQTGTLTLTGTMKHFVGGPDGWVVIATNTGQHAISGLTPSAFTLRPWQVSVNGGATENLNEIGFIRYLPKLAIWVCAGGGTGLYGGCLFTAPTLATAVWTNLGAVRPNTITYFHDVIEFGGDLYATVTPRGIRRSTDGGATWAEIILSAPSGVGPYQMETNGTVLLVYCWGAKTVYTSADNFAVGHSTGIGTDQHGVSIPYETVGRQMAVADGRFYIISGTYATDTTKANKCVVTDDGLTFSAPVALGIQSALGIAAGAEV